MSSYNEWLDSIRAGGDADNDGTPNWQDNSDDSDSGGSSSESSSDSSPDTSSGPYGGNPRRPGAGGSSSSESSPDTSSDPYGGNPRRPGAGGSSSGGPDEGETTSRRLRDDADSDPMNPQTEPVDVGGDRGGGATRGAGQDGDNLQPGDTSSDFADSSDSGSSDGGDDDGGSPPDPTGIAPRSGDSGNDTDQSNDQPPGVVDGGNDGARAGSPSTGGGSNQDDSGTPPGLSGPPEDVEESVEETNATPPDPTGMAPRPGNDGNGGSDGGDTGGPSPDPTGRAPRPGDDTQPPGQQESDGDTTGGTPPGQLPDGPGAEDSDFGRGDYSDLEAERVETWRTTNISEDQRRNYINLARQQAGPNENVYITETAGGKMTAIVGPDAEEAATLLSEQRVAEDIDSSLEQQTGEDVQRGEDYVIRDTGDGVTTEFTASYRQKRRQELEDQFIGQFEGTAYEDRIGGDEVDVVETEDGGLRAELNERGQQQVEYEQFQQGFQARRRAIVETDAATDADLTVGDDITVEETTNEEGQTVYKTSLTDEGIRDETAAQIANQNESVTVDEVSFDENGNPVVANGTNDSAQIAQQGQQQQADARARVVEDLEEQTGADLSLEDVDVDRTESGYEGTLSEQGEVTVARQNAPLQDTPLGGLFAAGAEIRTEIDQTRAPAADAYWNAVPSQSEIANVAGDAASAAAQTNVPFTEMSFEEFATGAAGAVATSAAASPAGQLAGGAAGYLNEQGVEAADVARQATEPVVASAAATPAGQATTAAVESVQNADIDVGGYAQQAAETAVATTAATPAGQAAMATAESVRNADVDVGGYANRAAEGAARTTAATPAGQITAEAAQQVSFDEFASGATETAGRAAAVSPAGQALNAGQAAGDLIPDSPQGTNPLLFRGGVMAKQALTGMSEQEAESELSKDIKATQEETYTAFSPAVGASPAGAARGATTLSRIGGSSGGLTRTGTALAGALGLAAGGNELLNDNSGEVQPGETVVSSEVEVPQDQSQSELEVTGEQPTELTVEESQTAEVELPGQEQTPVTQVQLGDVAIGGQTPVNGPQIIEEDIGPQQPERLGRDINREQVEGPEVTNPETNNGQVQERTIGTGSSAVADGTGMGDSGLLEAAQRPEVAQGSMTDLSDLTSVSVVSGVGSSPDQSGMVGDQVRTDPLSGVNESPTSESTSYPNTSPLSLGAMGTMTATATDLIGDVNVAAGSTAEASDYGPATVESYEYDRTYSPVAVTTASRSSKKRPRRLDFGLDESGGSDTVADPDTWSEQVDRDLVNPFTGE